MCLGIGLLLAMPGTAWGISGFAGGGTAVSAQYPDSAAAQSKGPNAEISDLDQVMHAIDSSRASDSDPLQALLPREIQAVSSGAGANLTRTGSIALLVAAIGVVLVGGVLRWRRGDAEAE